MKKVLLLCVLVLGLAVPSFAQEGASCTLDSEKATPELPLCNTPDDNECYTGGAMEDKCDTDWEWVAGWLLARFNNNLITREQFLKEYESILPKVVEEIPAAVAGGLTPPSLGCYLDDANNKEMVVSTKGDNYTVSEYPSNDGSCYDNYARDAVLAADFSSALKMCKEILSTYFAPALVSSSYVHYQDKSSPSNLWACDTSG
jgi:hypothetical protein